MIVESDKGSVIPSIWSVQLYITNSLYGFENRSWPDLNFGRQSSGILICTSLESHDGLASDVLLGDEMLFKHT